VITRLGGDVEKFMGDGIMATFNTRGDQPDHAVRAACAALTLQPRVAGLAQQHEGWPGVRVSVNAGGVVVREIGSDGYVACPAVGDTVNTGARLESVAPAGGVVIGART
jgi:adenylate cyclase